MQGGGGGDEGVSNRAWTKGPSMVALFSRQESKITAKNPVRGISVVGHSFFYKKRQFNEIGQFGENCAVIVLLKFRF